MRKFSEEELRVTNQGVLGAMPLARCILYYKMRVLLLRKFTFLIARYICFDQMIGGAIKEKE